MVEGRLVWRCPGVGRSAHLEVRVHQTGSEIHVRVFARSVVDGEFKPASKPITLPAKYLGALQQDAKEGERPNRATPFRWRHVTQRIAHAHARWTSRLDDVSDVAFLVQGWG